MLTRKTMIAAAVAGIALIGSAVAIAQTPPPGGPAHPDRDAMRRAMHERVCKEAPARLAGRIAYAEVKLGITDAQKSAWQAFTTEAKAAAQPMMKLCDTPPTNVRGDAAAELAQRERFLQATLDTTKAMRAAVEKLSPVLNADQKTKLADLIRMSGGRGMHRHGGHHMPPMHGPQPTNTPPAAPAPTK
ncbi:MAG: Spy/CpxP family protein refolding chaperone [Alphaproteobacteria bacterium]|nr:Spy/CpxP family protein refolding chaperone [Alphaproteobacteria bacterium]